MFTALKINDFRAIKNQEFFFGKYATMLSGWNATGKSTILALLANATELKAQTAKTYNGSTFRADFSEILKGSIKFDESKSNRLELIWNDGTGDDIRNFRTTWQNNNTRFRVIPIGEKNGERIDSKFDKPVIYLGLSRLFPLGEAETLSSKAQTFENEEDSKWFYKTHSEILSLPNDITSAENVDVKGTKKNTAGINTGIYDWKTNSSGQDNLGQILLAVLSFRKLKRDLRDSYKGGLLIIDELEASFHPIAQENIINFLVKEAKSSNFQLVFTTHSLHLIKIFSDKLRDNSGNLTHYFFTKANRNLKIIKDASYEDVDSDMQMKLYEKEKPKKIPVYTEDDEARWFIRKLFAGHTRKLEFRKVKLGCSNLINLMNAEPAFANYITVFDGDLTPKQIRTIKKHKSNYVLLPARPGKKEPIEKALHGFLNSADASDYFSKESPNNSKVKIEYFTQHDVELGGNVNEREAYKKWFNKHLTLFEKSKIIEYWKTAYPEETKKFVYDLKKVFNHIARKIHIPTID